jgi:hypothetical protein
MKGGKNKMAKTKKVKRETRPLSDDEKEFKRLTRDFGMSYIQANNEMDNRRYTEQRFRESQVTNDGSRLPDRSKYD